MKAERYISSLKFGLMLFPFDTIRVVGFSLGLIPVHSQVLDLTVVPYTVPSFKIGLKLHWKVVDCSHDVFISSTNYELQQIKRNGNFLI